MDNPETKCGNSVLGEGTNSFVSFIMLYLFFVHSGVALSLKVRFHYRYKFFHMTNFIEFMQPLNADHYDAIRNMASEIHAYAPDARILTTYYCGIDCDA